MLDLPIRFIRFYILGGLGFFGRVWSNTLALLEEDLAVGLMARLLFTPLFHDTSIVGRILSFFFRLSRIILGLTAFLVATIAILISALVWFGGWTLALIPKYGLFEGVYSTSGLYILALAYFLFVIWLFVDTLIFYPRLNLARLLSLERKNPSPANVWKATKLKKKDSSFQALLGNQEVKNLLFQLETTPQTFTGLTTNLTDETLKKVLELGKLCRAKYLTPAYFWVSLLYQIPNIESSLLKEDLALEDFEDALIFLEEKRQRMRGINIWDEEFEVRHLKGVNRGWLGAPTPNLDSVSTDLTREAASRGFPDFIGQSEVVGEVVNILSGQKGRNCLLVGPPGSGRSTLVNYLAKMIVTGNAPDSLATKRLVSIDSAKLLSGVISEGDLAEKIKAVFEEVKAIENIIIYIDEIHSLGIGDAGANFNLYSLLLPQIESDRIQFLASTEDRNYARILERDGSFARLFTKIEVKPSTPRETKLILIDRAVEIEKWHKIKITYKAINEAVKLCFELIHNRVLPDSALAVLTESLTLAQGGVIDSKIVKEAIGKRVNIPLEEVNEEQREVLLNLEDLIHERLIDQQEAVRDVADTLRRAAAQLREKSRPIGSFLFVGPTGVGKTELSKILADVYFKEKGVFLRFDMSEYQSNQAIDRLIGVSDGPGELTEVVKEKPYALILLDEFEKADPKILNLFLQVLDDGRLTDSRGVLVDFTNTIIIATSNAGSVQIAQELEKGISMEEVKRTVHDELLKSFKPELVNRFDEIVVFKPLSKMDLEEIVKIKLASLGKQLKEEGYLVDFSPDLVTKLAEKGFDPVLGARPLRRFIQDTLEAKLSRMILEHRLNKGETFRTDQGFLS